VLSTLHTNTAVGAIARLRDMGVEPFLLASSLIGLLAQRLVRVLCSDCHEPSPADARACEILGADPADPPTIYRPAEGGCESCRNAGYRGRTGIYELIEVDDDMRAMIHDGTSEQKLDHHARRRSPSIRADGRRKILAGITSLEEVLRVTRED
jgi:general secretion pathway protein E